MFDSVKDYAFSMKEKVKETVVSYTSKSEIEKILIEATANENWNIANSKLQILADAAHQFDNCQRILEHLKSKLEVPAFEWRRILKSLSAMEYLLKNGPQRVQQDLRNDMFKVTTLQNFTYYEDNIDKGNAIREKAILIADLLTQPHKLEQEREQARQYREKFYSRQGGVEGGSSYSGGSNYNMSNNMGYGGYSQSQQQVGSIGNIAKNVGHIASEAGSYLSSGISYISTKAGYGGGSNSQVQNMSSGKMMGFGSDSMYGGSSGYSGGTNYNPPGGSYSYNDNSESIMKQGSQPRWGQQTTAPPSTSQYKPMNEPTLNKTSSTNKSPLFSGVSDDKSKKKKSKSDKKKRKQTSSDSESSSSEEESSDDDKKKKKKGSGKKQKIKSKTVEQEINLLELDTQQQQTNTTNQPNSQFAFDFLSGNDNNNQQQKQQQQPNDLIEMLSQDTKQHSTDFLFMQQPVTNNQFQFNQQPQMNMFNNNNPLGGLQFNTQSQQQQQQQQQNLFSNLQLKTSQDNTQQQQQQQQQEQQKQQEEQNKDAWSMGKNLVNLTNLKQSMSLDQDTPSFLQSSNGKQQQQNNNAVYIKTNQGATQPKFIPGIFAGQQQTQSNIGSQQQTNQQQFFMNQQQQTNTGGGFTFMQQQQK